MAATQLPPQMQAPAATPSDPVPDPNLHILHRIWPRLNLTESSIQTESYKVFTAHFHEQFQLIENEPSIFAAQTPKETIDLLPKLRQDWRSKTKQEVVEELKPQFPNASEDAIISSLDLAVGVWLTLAMKSLPTSLENMEEPSAVVDWKTDTTIENCLTKQFQKAETPVREGKLKYTRKLRLTVANLTRLADVNIDWTNNLADHLEFDRSTRTLKIYQHKLCLFNHLNHAKKELPFIPLALIEETIDTLNFLFPIGDTPTTNLLVNHNQVFNSLGTCGRLVSDHTRYAYWGERLQELADILTEPPESLKHFRSGRATIMDSINLWNFLIAAFVLILTTLNIVFGTFAAVYGYKQYRIAQIQFCMQANGSAIPPGIC